MNSPTFLALASLATASALALSGCTVHTHAEWHSGTSRSVSTGSEEVPHEHSSAREPRRSNAGRGHVVRVTTSDKNVSHPDGRDGRGGERGVVRVSGPAPAGSSGDSDSGRGVARAEPEAGGSAGEGGAAAGVQDSSPSEASGSTGSDTGAASPAPGAADDAREPEKGTLKRESEPHIARPIKRPNKGPRRVSEEAPLKGGRRE